MADGVASGRKTVAALASMTVIASLVVVTPTALAAAPETSDLQYYQAVVHVLPSTDEGFAGTVSFTRVVGGSVSLDVQLIRATTVACAEGEDIAWVTVTTDSFEATEPGPVTLDIDRRLRTAHGVAVVDLVQTEFPGCGAPETTTALPAQPVSIEVTGTSVRFRTGVDGSSSVTAHRDLTSAFDLARDGTGSVAVGSVIDQTSDSAFLKYAVEHRRTHGVAPVPPANVAPEGGAGAQGAFTTVVDRAPGELGVVVEDVFVTATTGAPPESASMIDALAIRVSVVSCPSGGTAHVTEAAFGFGPGVVDIDSTLAQGHAEGTLAATRFVENGCDVGSEPTEESVELPVTLSLAGVGPAVRVKDTFFQVTPGSGNDRTRVSYVGRDAVGTVSVGDISGEISADTGLASMSRAGR